MEDPRDDDGCDRVDVCMVCERQAYDCIPVGAGWVCLDCWEREMVECVGCGADVLSYEAEQIDGEWYCEECLAAMEDAEDETKGAEK